MESVFKFWKNVERKAQELIPLQVFPAQVKEVDENNRTCTVRVNDNVDLYEVKLYAVTDKDLKGFCLIPAQDSQVLVARIANGNDLFVCSFSVVDKVVGTIGKHTSLLVEDEHLLLETEKVTIDIAKDKVTVDADKEEGIVINGGKNKGLVKIDVLNDNLDSIKSFVESMHQQLAKGLGSLDFAFKGLGVETGASTTYNTGMSEKSISIKDMEDTKIKH